MLYNELIEKRKQLIAEFDGIKAKTTEEKRSAYTNEERTRVNEIKIELSELDERIEAEKTIEEKRNKQLDIIGAPAIIKSVTNDEFRSVLQSNNGGKFTMPQAEFEKRATITTTSNGQFSFTDMKEGVSIAEPELVLESLGAQVAFFDAGNVDYPSMGNIEGAFQSAQDTTIIDRDPISTAKRTLVPTFVSASLEVSKSFIAQSKAKNMEDLKNALVYGIKKAVERRALDSMSTLTAVASGSTAVNFYGAVLNQEASILGSGTGYIFSRFGVERAKRAKVDAQGVRMVMTDGMINGYPAKRSPLITNVNHAFYGDFRSVVMGYWGDVQLEVITDATLARKGNVLVIASSLADASYVDANKIAVLKNVNLLTL